MTWIAPQSPPDDAARIHEHRRQLLLVRGYFDDLAGFPADTQANILTRLRELAALTGEPMLTHDQTEALVRERDTAIAEADALRAEVARLRPLRALFDRAQTAGVLLMVVHRPDGAWFASVNDHVVTGEAGSFDVVIAAACDRLGVDHG